MAAILLNPSSITLLQAKTSVARVVGSSSDSDQLALAAETIRDVLLDFNNIRDWTWLQNSATVNVTTDGLATVPSRFKKVYSATIPTNTLYPLVQRDRDRQTQPTDSFGGTFFYSTYDTTNTTKIELLDHPAAAVVLTLRFQRMIDMPAADGTTFDLPEAVMSYVLAQAKADFIASRGGNPERMMHWNNRAKEFLTALIVDDQRRLDEDAQITPGYLTSQEPSWRDTSWMVW